MLLYVMFLLFLDGTGNGVTCHNIPCSKDLEVLKNGLATLQKTIEQLKTHYDTRLSILQTKLYELQNELHRQQDGHADIVFDRSRKQNGMVYFQREAGKQQDVSTGVLSRKIWQFGDKEPITLNTKYDEKVPSQIYFSGKLPKNGSAHIFGGKNQEQLRKMVVQQDANQQGSSVRSSIRNLNTTSNTKLMKIEKKMSIPKFTEQNRYVKIVEGIQNQESQGRKSRRQTDHVDTAIAFSARSDILSNIGLGEHVIFGNVITNIGNMYNSQTGNFHCEIPGVYVFFVTVYSQSGRFITTEITKNGMSLSYVASPSLSNFIGPASNMVVIDLQKGDAVWIRSGGLYSGSVMDNWSTFSGFLLK